MAQNAQMVPVLKVSAPRLPDNDQWCQRFEIRSQSSPRVYIVSQNKQGRFWGCSCPGWRTGRKCKHLTAIGLPAHKQPYEAVLA